MSNIFNNLRRKLSGRAYLVHTLPILKGLTR
jgi:hypothetical protein